MKSLEIRKRFFDFFTQRNHEQVASSSLIPAQDPTLLFANAGMNQFKDVFLGKEKRSYTRAVSIQKCVRAGGKHNDLDNVGFTKRHLTFFEMMGNFSFGDYFKKEAIHCAWDFLTKDLAIAPDNLHATVYKTDDESYAIWHKEIGLPESKIHRLGEKDNFWQMGDIGPCGPCTEIHVDRGTDANCPNQQDCGPACDCDRFLEIWNLVFMQFDRQTDGALIPLKQTGVDTGMGLERLSVVMQNKDSVFHTDLFIPIIHKIEELVDKKYAEQSPEVQAAFHVLADHIRSSSLLIADGCAPSNEGRGYVLRKIIRRAALFAQKLTAENIFPHLSTVVVAELGSIYPELKTNQDLIIKLLESEINKFAQNLIRGQAILGNYFNENKATKIISGEQAFKLYDTFGFPIELIHLIAKERGFTVDEHNFILYMHKQQEQSGKKTTDPLDHLALPDEVKTEFTGYNELQTTSEITALIVNDAIVEQVAPQETCWIITKKSPFFIVGGGQVPDEGSVTIKGIKANVEQARYINGRIALRIKAPTALALGDTVTAAVNKTWRTNAMKNHTATHMLQAALIEELGKTVKQSGSLVHPDYLRFDFTYHEILSPEMIAKIEDLVNAKIQEDIPVSIEYSSLNEATKRGVIAFFGDKYNPEKVRIVNIPDFSAELCGGTHVHRTGEIGIFKITEVSALSAGHKRIVAVTGPRAVEIFQQSFATVKTLSQEFKVKREAVLEQVFKQKEQIKQLDHQITNLKQKHWKSELESWKKQTQLINGIPFLYVDIPNATVEDLRTIAQQLQKAQSGFYFLTSMLNNRFIFVASTSDAIQINLKQLSQWLAQEYAIRGGGSGLLLQGGSENVPADLEKSLIDWIANNNKKGMIIE